MKSAKCVHIFKLMPNPSHDIWFLWNMIVNNDSEELELFIWMQNGDLISKNLKTLTLIHKKIQPWWLHEFCHEHNTVIIKSFSTCEV